jgi:arabinogalactan endo-1,4-beta-galactosidase
VTQPRDNGLYGQYLTTLIQRYGPGGSFWAQHPELPRRPLRMWEIWNEPDILYYWPTYPFARSYVALLRAAHSAIRRADPGARVVLGGLTNYSWRDLASIYHVPGARRVFDVVEVHPYSKYPANVIRIMSYVRATMDKAGDRGKPMIAGEIAWPSSLQHTRHSNSSFDIETTRAGQARNVRAVLPLLAAKRRALGLTAFYWYTWTGDEYPGASPFNFAGLVALHDGQLSAKPALAAFDQMARAIER